MNHCSFAHSIHNYIVIEKESIIRYIVHGYHAVSSIIMHVKTSMASKFGDL